MQHSPAITLFKIIKIDCENHVNETKRGSIHLNTKSYAMIYCCCRLVLGNNQMIQLVQQAGDTSRLLTPFENVTQQRWNCTESRKYSKGSLYTTISAVLKRFYAVLSAGPLYNLQYYLF